MTVKCSLGHENPDGSAYCDECGEPLASPAPDASAAPASAAPVVDQQACPSCGTMNPAGEAFCANCGAPLMTGAAPAPAPPAPAPSVAPSPAPAPEPTPAEPPAPAPAVAGTGLQARLIVEADNQEFDISGKDNILIGREDAVSNIFPDIDLTPHGGEEGGVSRQHAHIFVENSQYMLEDENSTNFTFLNRQRLNPKTPTPLHDNDEIKLGRVLLRFKTP
jgi:hypothetical protein